VCLVQLGKNFHNSPFRVNHTRVEPYLCYPSLHHKIRLGLKHLLVWNTPTGMSEIGFLLYPVLFLFNFAPFNLKNTVPNRWTKITVRWPDRTSGEWDISFNLVNLIHSHLSRSFSLGWHSRSSLHTSLLCQHVDFKLGHQNVLLNWAKEVWKLLFPYSLKYKGENFLGRYCKFFYNCNCCCITIS
jgi:hypothetical protein